MSTETEERKKRIEKPERKYLPEIINSEMAGEYRLEIAVDHQYFVWEIYHEQERKEWDKEREHLQVGLKFQANEKLHSMQRGKALTDAVERVRERIKNELFLSCKCMDCEKYNGGLELCLQILDEELEKLNDHK